MLNVKASHNDQVYIFQQLGKGYFKFIWIVEHEFLLTWKCSFMEFYNWFGAISAFDRNFFASSVLFNLLLELKKESLKNDHAQYTYIQAHMKKKEKQLNVWAEMFVLGDLFVFLLFLTETQFCTSMRIKEKRSIQLRAGLTSGLRLASGCSW